MAEHEIDRLYPVLNNLSRTLGRLFGVEISVLPFENDVLMFVDDTNEVITDGESAVLCASKEEIETGVALQLFSGRALYAAAVKKCQLLGA